MKNTQGNSYSHSERVNYLSTVSPGDKPWEKHKARSDLVRDLYKETILPALSGRIDACGGILEFGLLPPDETGCSKLKLKSARFCRARFCPVCQWRRKLMWFSRFINVLPLIEEDYPKVRYIFLTLTVKNCKIEELKSTIKWMNQSWHKLIKRKTFPGIGFVKSTEVTRNRDQNTVHPHFHILIMVNPSYFDGKNYMNQKEWMKLWKDSLKINYDPVINIKIVKPKSQSKSNDSNIDSANIKTGLIAAAHETLKYTVKEQDLIGKGTSDDAKFLEELTCQMHKTRAVSLGGIFKEYLSESGLEDDATDAYLESQENLDELPMDESKNLVEAQPEVEEEDNGSDTIYFGWRENLKRYVKKN